MNDVPFPSSVAVFGKHKGIPPHASYTLIFHSDGFPLPLLCAVASVPLSSGALRPSHAAISSRALSTARSY